MASTLHVSRTVLLAAATLVAAVALLFAAAPGARAATAPMLDYTEIAEIRTINAYRAARGLPTLRIDYDLTRTATWMAGDMIRNNRFSHTDSAGRDPFARLAAFGYPSNTWRGENLAAGNADARSTFIQWRNSPGHNVNMLRREYRAVGVARICSTSSRYGCYWVTTFGSQFTRVTR